MALFKCKMCGGALEILNNETVVECDYCGARQTIPKLDDDRRANLYDRANHFRRNNEFDKAMGIYEQILNEDNADAEAYWSLVLCQYGIEYVEDPSSRKRVPTVNRAQFTSIFEDDNYKSALRYADLHQKAVYENEAKAINEIQKSILAISQREEPFDVFICYKESDNAGRRTPDSVLANDLYHQLVQEGFKVFFARITLEDKLGSAYEPYIFAALNSAKVMVVLGTRPEYFNAVWVKNEWSRYLSLIKNGARKMLIPAYKDMDPYDLPEEFSHLQAQDMSKLGFMQDLIRGVKKILDVDASRSNVVKETIVAGNANTAPLLKRAFMFLEDGDWRSADEYCEKVLDLDPECAEAYLGKLMVELKVTSQQKLKDCAAPFDGKNNFQKAMRFAGENLKKELQGYIDFIINRNLTNAYNDAVRIMQSAKTEEAYKKASAKFKELHNFKDSKELAEKCSEEAEQARLLALYNSAVSARNSAETEKQFKAAANRFAAIGMFKDSETLAAECLDLAEKARIEALYASALTAMNTAKSEQQYKTAAEQFEAIKSFKDAQEQYIACLESAEASRKDAIYSAGIVLMNNRVKRIEDFQAAIEEFQKIYGWKDADDKIIECQDTITKINAEIFEQEQQQERERQARLAAKKKRKKRNLIIGIIAAVLVCAVVILTTVIIPNIQMKEIKERLGDAKAGDYIKFGTYAQNYSGGRKEEIEWLVLEKREGKLLVISKYILDCEPYNTVKKEVTWETCTLHKWLNNNFMKAAFSSAEKSMISEVSLLSVAQANRYFRSDKERECMPTSYAVTQGVKKRADGNAWWWLRDTSTNYPDRASTVSFGTDDIEGNNGHVRTDGDLVDSSYTGIRPVLWIDIAE